MKTPSRLPSAARGILLLVLSLAAASPSAGEQPPAGSRVHRRTLANGLRVSLCHDPAVASVAMKIAFRVTFRDDPPDRQGIGPLAFMTLIGQGRESYVPRVERLGGWWDPTNIYPEVRAQDIVLFSRDLPEGVSIFREILQSAGKPVRDPAMYERDRKTALGIMRPGAFPSVITREAFGEPWAGNDPMGVRSMIEGLTEKEVLDFQRTRFVPARTHVVIAGAFPPAATLRLMEKELGTLPNPPDAVPAPNELRRFRPGTVCVVEKGPIGPSKATQALRFGCPVPSGVPTATANVVAALLAEALKASPGCAGAIVEMDSSSAQRVLKIAVPADPMGVRAAAESCLDGLPARIPADKVAAVSGELRARNAFPRLSNVYWKSWPVAFANEPLGWAFHAPGAELARFEAMTAKEVQEAARAILDPARRLTIASAPDEEGRGKLLEAFPAGERKEIEPAAEAAFPDLPPPAADPAFPPAIRNPSVRQLAGGSVLFLEDPGRPWFSLGGIYPLGVLERRTRAYAKALEETVPVRQPQAFSFAPGMDSLSFRMNLPLWTEKDLMEWIGKVQAWTAAAGAPGIPPCPLPALDHETKGEAPGWVLCVTGPRPVEALDALRLPGKPFPAQALAKPLGDPLPAPDGKGPVVLAAPLGDMRDPARRAAALCLTQWLDPDSRKDHQYGPFSLALPPLAHPPLGADEIGAGGTDYLVLRFGKGGSGEEILAWVRGGADLPDALGRRVEYVQNLKGLALTAMQNRFVSSPPCAAMAQALARMGGVDPDFLDRVHEELRRLDAEAISTAARDILSRAAAIDGGAEEAAGR